MPVRRGLDWRRRRRPRGLVGRSGHSESLGRARWCITVRYALRLVSNSLWALTGCSRSGSGSRNSQALHPRYPLATWSHLAAASVLVVRSIALGARVVSGPNLPSRSPCIVAGVGSCRSGDLTGCRHACEPSGSPLVSEQVAPMGVLFCAGMKPGKFLRVLP